MVAKLRRGSSGIFARNVAARVGALVSLALATIVVAWAGGPEAVGIFALARVLPGLVGVVMAAGVPGAIAYFLAGRHRDDRRLPLTIVALALAGGVAGTALWTAGSPLIGKMFFPSLPLGLVMLTGLTVLTQLLVATAKSCSQGSDDMAGANLAILNEELLFLPAYGLLWVVGIHGEIAVVLGLIFADVATFIPAWGRLARRGFFNAALRPSMVLAREIGYGLRQQVGGVMFLLNLRLDFILLSAIAGPAVLGIYAVASKFAELIKVPGMALQYVLYPRYASQGPAKAAEGARRMLPKVAGLSVIGVIPLGAAATWFIPFAYGAEFEPAVLPAQIILLGLLLEGVTGMLSGFFYGIGRPGLNSWAMGAGLIATAALDILLIPRFGANGAAAASAVAYMLTTVALYGFFVALRRTPLPSRPETVALSTAEG